MLLFFGKAKLVWVGKCRYHIVVKWYLLKMDSGFEFEKKKMITKYFHGFFWIDFLDIFPSD